MRSPRRHHTKNHQGLFETCWTCGRDRAVCLSKLRFATWQEADEWVIDYNESRKYAPPLMTRYRCRWCEQWHMKTARDGHTRARMDKQRRKWLAESEANRRAAAANDAAFDAWLRTGTRSKTP